jgi:uncharacterized protein (TIGR02611 family)
MVFILVSLKSTPSPIPRLHIGSGDWSWTIREWLKKRSKITGRHKRDGDSPRKSSRFRRLMIGVIGFTVLLIGVVMIVLPGPATLVIPLGLGILATEFIWARRLAEKVQGQLKEKGLRLFRWFKQRYL